MGLWSWVMDQLMPHDEAASGSATYTDSAGSVAVLEAPNGEQDVATNESEAPWWSPLDAELLEPPIAERLNLCTEARALENLLVSHFDGHDLKMPPLNHVAERVLRQIRKREMAMSSIAQTIGEDQVITAAVLRMANSPLYRGLDKITTLLPAATRLGARALQTLMMHESLRAAMMDGSQNEQDLAELLWYRSLASACVMRDLSRFTAIDEEEAYLIGLLHDIGSVIVLRITAKNETHTQYQVDAETFDYLCAESHQEFGELIADAWELPDNIKTIIANHHVYPEPDDPLRNERLQLQLADMICSLLGFEPYQLYDLKNSRAVQDLGLLQKPGFDKFLDELPDRLERSLKEM